MCLYLGAQGANDKCSVSPGSSLLWLISVCVCLQETRPVTKPVVEEYGDDLYADLYDDLSVSTVTVGPNVTEYEVG